MDTTLAVSVLLVLGAVVVILGVIIVLALLIAYVVRICVAKTRPQDMVEQFGQISGLVNALERYTPRHQGGRELAAPLRNLPFGNGQAGAAQPPVAAGVEASATTQPAGGVQ